MLAGMGFPMIPNMCMYNEIIPNFNHVYKIHGVQLQITKSYLIIQSRFNTKGGNTTAVDDNRGNRRLIKHYFRFFYDFSTRHM